MYRIDCRRYWSSQWDDLEVNHAMETAEYRIRFLEMTYGSMWEFRVVLHVAGQPDIVLHQEGT